MLWVAVEPIHKQILGVYISRHRNMIVVEAFLSALIRIYGKHTVYSDGGNWYPEACVSLGLKHRLHSSYEKSIKWIMQSAACIHMANSFCVQA